MALVVDFEAKSLKPKRVSISAPFVAALSGLLAVLAVCLMQGRLSSPLLRYVPDMATTAQYREERLENLSEAELRVQLERITVKESYMANKAKQIQLNQMNEEHHRALKRQKFALLSEMARRGITWSEATNPADK